MIDIINAMPTTAEGRLAQQIRYNEDLTRITRGKRITVTTPKHKHLSPFQKQMLKEMERIEKEFGGDHGNAKNI